MTVYTQISLFFGLAILITFFNEKLNNKVQTTIVLTAIALFISLTLYVLHLLGINFLENITIHMMNEINFENFVLNGILGFLIFAGSLNINLEVLKDQKWEVFIFSLLSTLLSTFIIGFIIYFIADFIGITLPLIYALLFGALISPTDPIAVLAIIKILKAPKRLSIQVEGESLFNDGVGLVIFVTIFSAAYGQGADVSVLSTLAVFFHQSIGGLIFGAILGFIAHKLIIHTEDHALIILLTALLPTTGYVLALYFKFSGPLSMVVSGIMIGNITLNKKYNSADVATEKNQLLHFWSMTEHFLNSVLFLLIGFAFVLLKFNHLSIILMFLAIPVCLFDRYLILIPLK